MPTRPVSGLRIRWLGRVSYADALSLQRRLHSHSPDNHLLLLEHPHVVTLGRRGRHEHVLTDVEALGASVVDSDRGGEATYHGPGQLVGYPILTVPGKRGGGMADTAAYVESLEQLLIDVLAELGLAAGRRGRHVGVWIDPDGPRPRKIAAIGVRLVRARSMHGFALNVDPDLTWFDTIAPCGVAGLPVTSLRAEGFDMPMRDVVDRVARLAEQLWSHGGTVDRADVAHRVDGSDATPLTDISTHRGTAKECELNATGMAGSQAGISIRRSSATKRKHDLSVSVRLLGRLAQAGVDASVAVPYRSRKPEWMRVGLNTGPGYRRLRSTMRDLDLVTVCEEAGCPNIYECWNDGTATFMILGERCTRACAFCLVDTSRPAPPDAGEPVRVAEAAARMGLEHVVVTMVARDDLADGGADMVAATVGLLRSRLPSARVEVLISDLGGDPVAQQRVFHARPDVLSHNVETVARLQRAVRPSAGYARSMAVLCRAKEAGLTAKSSIVVGMGETHREVVQTLSDLHAVGVDVVTVGQYLRPSARHLPVARWWPPEAFEQWKEIGESMGISYVQASPMTRSSYHASQAAAHHEQISKQANGEPDDR